VQLYRYFVSQYSGFCRHNPSSCISTSVYRRRRLFRYDSVRKLLDTPFIFVPAIKYHNIRILGRSGTTLLNNLGPRWTSVISFTSRSLCLRVKLPLYPLNRDLGGVQSQRDKSTVIQPTACDWMRYPGYFQTGTDINLLKFVNTERSSCGRNFTGLQTLYTATISWPEVPQGEIHTKQNFPINIPVGSGPPQI